MSDPGGGVGATIQAHTAQTSAQMKQVLAAYARNAHTLTGPSRLEEIGSGKFKLASDVVLHRVGGPLENGSFRRDAANYANCPPLDINKQIWLQRERFLRQVQEQRIQSDKERMRERQNRHSGTERGSNHLSGEEIRLLRESQKEAEKQRMEADRRAKGEEKDSKLKSAFKPPPVTIAPPNMSAVPIMSSNDKSWSELEETIIDGERISCFNVGGEPRLCLPQFLNSVLERLSLKDINQACEELQIYCATCSPEQLQVLKESKVLPETAYQCGLITKSDAERLCSFLLERNPPRASIRLGDPKTSPFSFRVEHDCFGRCEGLLLPEAYTGPNARCIECIQCEGLFSPSKFVSHAHDNTENRTCHWGFSADNWRVYLRLHHSYTEEESECHTKVLDNFKLRYLPVNGTKRQQEDDHYEVQAVYSHSKRSKGDEEKESPFPLVNYLGLPAFRPWSPSKAGGGYQPPYPVQMSSSPYTPRRPAKEKEARKIEMYPVPVTLQDRIKEASSPFTVHPKKKYLEKVEGERFPTLADEISTIKEALEGAPVHAKEAVLKILERLTQRVDRAERERDLATSRHRQLTIKFDQVEEELGKKRAELRELLRQDSSRTTASTETRKSESSTEKGRSETGDEKTSESDKASERSATNGGSTVVVASGLPKIELKSPARIMEEIAESRSRSNSVRSEERSEPDQTTKKIKASESLKERMVKMEAELTSLRSELSAKTASGSSSPATKGGLSPGTSSSPSSLPPSSSHHPTQLSITTQSLGSNGANSSSPTPSPPSHADEQSTLTE